MTLPTAICSLSMVYGFRHNMRKIVVNIYVKKYDLIQYGNVIILLANCVIFPPIMNIIFVKTNKLKRVNNKQSKLPKSGGTNLLLLLKKRLSRES